MRKEPDDSALPATKVMNPRLVKWPPQQQLSREEAIWWHHELSVVLLLSYHHKQLQRFFFFFFSFFSFFSFFCLFHERTHDLNTFFFFFKDRQKKGCQNSARDLSLLPVTTTERFACKTRTKIFSSSFSLAHHHHYQPSFSCWHR
jgi:hypothetical protein